MQRETSATSETHAICSHKRILVGDGGSKNLGRGRKNGTRVFIKTMAGIKNAKKTETPWDSSAYGNFWAIRRHYTTP